MDTSHIEQPAGAHIAVAVRIRKKLNSQKERYEEVCATRTEEMENGQGISVVSSDVTMHGPTASVRSASMFVFDQVFDDADDQRAVFETWLKPEVIAAFEHSRNVSVMAYGQTGSGKTHTILGGASPRYIAPDAGLVTRLLDELLTQIEAQRHQGVEMAIGLTAVEVYNDCLYDLLHSDKAILSYREIGDELLLDRPVVHHIDTHAAAARAFAAAAKNRVTASTGMNDASSRSHALFFIDAFRRRSVRGSTAMDVATIYAAFNALKVEKATSKSRPQYAALANTERLRFTLVDLAGSERVKRSGVHGEQMVEAQHVNKSLSALGNVIRCIETGAKHIPFRDSRLTRLLRSSLCEHECRVKVIMTISPVFGDVDDSLTTLRFAKRLKEIPVDDLERVRVGASALSRTDREHQLLQLERVRDDLLADVAIARQGYSFVPYRLSTGGVTREAHIDAQRRAHFERLTQTQPTIGLTYFLRMLSDEPFGWPDMAVPDLLGSQARQLLCGLRAKRAAMVATSLTVKNQRDQRAEQDPSAHLAKQTHDEESKDAAQLAADAERRVDDLQHQWEALRAAAGEAARQLTFLTERCSKVPGASDTERIGSQVRHDARCIVTWRMDDMAMDSLVRRVLTWALTVDEYLTSRNASSGGAFRSKERGSTVSTLDSFGLGVPVPPCKVPAEMLAAEPADETTVNVQPPTLQEITNAARPQTHADVLAFASVLGRLRLDSSHVLRIADGLHAMEPPMTLAEVSAAAEQPAAYHCARLISLIPKQPDVLLQAKTYSAARLLIAPVIECVYAARHGLQPAYASAEETIAVLQDAVAYLTS
jgi:hypothetical protein